MSFVYLMVGDDAIKVGKANDPDARLEQVKAGLGPGAHIHMVVRCRSERRAFDIEQGIHRILAPHRLAGEGFGRECYARSAIDIAVSIMSAIEDEPAMPRTRRRRGVCAFGETRSLAQWAADSRCAVTAGALHYRLKNGWDPERAISAPAYNATIIHAFGEDKTATEWALDERCSVTSSTIRDRLLRGWATEDAVSRPPSAQHRAISVLAFGETKTLSEWSADERCSVSRLTLRDRLRRGWDPEIAVSAPPLGF